MNPLLQFHGEILALQIAVQRMLGMIVLSNGPNAAAIMRAEHAQASTEMANATIPALDPASVGEIRAHAHAMLDDIYSIAAGSKPGKSTQGRP